MPLLTHLSSLHLDLSQNVIDNAKLKEVLRQLYESSEQSVVQAIIESWKNPLWQLINTSGNITLAQLSAIKYNFNTFDEQSWVLLHLACASCSEVALFLPTISSWLLTANSRSENALQARLFLMSQPGFDFDQNADIVQPILDSNDSWALFALLSHPKFSLETYSVENLRQRLLAAFRAELVDYKESEADKNAALIWIFIKSSGITNAEGSTTLLNNIVALNVVRDLCQFNIETLTAMIKLSNRVEVLKNDTKNFLSMVWCSLVARWDQSTSEQLRELQLEQNKGATSAALSKKIAKYKSANAEEIINQFVYMIRRSMLDNVLSNGDKANIAIKVNEALSFPAAAFFCGVFSAAFWDALQSPSRRCGTLAVDWIMELTIFHELEFCLNKRDVNGLLTAFYNSNDEYFIGKITEKLLAYERFPKEVYSAVIIAIVNYALQHDANQMFKKRPEVKQIVELSSIFDGDTTHLSGMLITISHPKVFVHVLKNHFAPALNAAMNNQSEASKVTSYKRIRRTADLVKQLSLEDQVELYKDDRYILFRLLNRRLKYERQLAKNERYGLGRELKKEHKMSLLNWLIYNFDAIKNDEFDGYKDCPMQFAYRCIVLNNKVQPTIDRISLNDWLQHKILYNRPRIQGSINIVSTLFRCGKKPTADQGMKGSKMAETLVLFSVELLGQIFKRTDISFLTIWNAAYPSKKCDTDQAAVRARNTRLNEMILLDVIDDGNHLPIGPAVVNPIITNINNTASADSSWSSNASSHFSTPLPPPSPRKQKLIETSEVTGEGWRLFSPSGSPADSENDEEKRSLLDAHEDSSNLRSASPSFNS